MTRTRMGRLLPFKSFGHRHHHASLSATASSSSPSSSSMDVALMEEKLASSEAIVVKWDPDASAFAKITSLFYEDRSEARRFLAHVTDLQRVMLAFVAAAGETARLSHPCLVRAQTLMQAAMRRLEKEFYQILAANRDLLDPESVSVRSSLSNVSDDEPGFDPSEFSPEEDAIAAGVSIAKVEHAAAVVMADLRAIADTMVFAGYGKECVRTYVTLRKSIVDEGLYRLGFERVAASRLHKMDWAVLELKVSSWLGASRLAVRTLFHGERVLLDHVFAGSDSVREAVFSDIARDAAVHFLAFPVAVAKSKRSPEKLFRLLDMYDTIAELWQEIELVFSFESTVAVREQALAALSKLAKAARVILPDFESAIIKKSSRSPVPGGGVHPMTRYTMNYISQLADHESALADIFSDLPLPTPGPIPAFFFDVSQATPLQLSASTTSSVETSLSVTLPSGEEGRRSAVAARLAWPILALLCKLDRKAEVYGDAALSYLFLANNLQYVVNKVRSSRLLGLLGEDWAARHAAKARQHAAGYEQMSWGLVAATVPALEVSPADAIERFRAFSAALEATCAAQASWVVADEEMREEVRETVVSMVVPAYRGFYARWREMLESDVAGVRLSPDDVRERLGELFSGSDSSGSNRTKASSRPGPCS
ncbi:hypothetical protein Cni_G17216 [Canna indica]|uniref:Exocyst subunit Exo70 family protein n=1 Tax=Canna indica TaxID=4628 RepID=A0AAQ3KGM7_9LILI|nr:hypothetical protein Cni_G17216 [Canna indica]